MPALRVKTAATRRALRAACIFAITLALAGIGSAQQSKSAGSPAVKKSPSAAKASSLPKSTPTALPAEKKAPATPADKKSPSAAKASSLPKSTPTALPAERKAPAPPADKKSPSAAKASSLPKSTPTALPAERKAPAPPAAGKKIDSGELKAQGKDAAKDTEAEKKKREEDKKKKEEERDRKKVEWIEKTLEYGIQQNRLEAMGMIPGIRNPGEKERLGRLLRTTLKEEIDIEVKAKAIYVIGEIKFREALPELTLSLEDESQDVKIAAIYAMKRINDKSVAGRLSDELKKQDMKKQSNYTEAIIDILGSFKVKELKDFAVGAIKKDSTDTSIRQHLVLFLGKVEAVDARDFLLGLAKDDSEDTMIRSYAVNSLARMSLKDTGPEIDKILKVIDTYPFKKRQNYHKLYMYSIAALAKMGDKSVFPRLMNAIRSNNEQVRLQAVRLIKEINEKRTIDILKYKMKNDPSTKVQRAAREALVELGIPVEEDKQKKDSAPESKEGK